MVAALAATAPAAAAANAVVCSGGRIAGTLVGSEHNYFDVSVPVGATVSVSGTITITSHDTTGGWQSILWVDGAGGFWLAGTYYGGPAAWPESSSSGANPGPATTVTLDVHQQYGVNVEYSFVVTVSTPGPCAADLDELVLGGSNPSEPNTCGCQRSVGDPIDTRSGNFFHTFQDFAIPGRGPGLHLARVYNSLAASSDGPFGYGWQGSAMVALHEDPLNSSVTVQQETGSSSLFWPASGGTYTTSSNTDATLLKYTGVGWTFTRHATDVLNFNTAGQLVSEEDLNGETTSYAYDGAGHLTTMTDPAGRTLTYTWTGTHVTSVADSSSPACGPSRSPTTAQGTWQPPPTRSDRQPRSPTTRRTGC